MGVIPADLLSVFRVDVVKDDTGKIIMREKSIPESSRVFLNSEFIGLTPLEPGGLEPGNYRIEIRSGGYKAYLGKIS